MAGGRVGIDRTEAAAGLLFIGFGAFFGVQALGLEMGTSLRMGPGYFPLVLSGLLVFLGLVILIGALRRPGEGIGRLAIRGGLLILPAPVVFGLTVGGLGFVPSLFVATFIAALASRRMTLRMALLVALGVTVFSTLVFNIGLGLPFRRFGPWLGF